MARPSESRDCERNGARSTAETLAAPEGQRRLESTLRESAEYFDHVVAGVRDYAILLLDPLGFIQTWNAGAERVNGYRAQEIIGEHFSRFYPAEAVRRGFPQDELRVAKTTGRFEDEGWRVRKDGTRFWANVVLTALYHEDGGLRGYLKITRDLTERKQTEEALRQGEERFRQIIEGVSDYAIFMLDAEGHVTTWNIGAERIKRYRADEIIGRHFSIFYPPEAVERSWPQYELEVAAEEGRFEDEGWRVRSDGTQFWANVVITAIRDEEGGATGFLKSDPRPDRAEVGRGRVAPSSRTARGTRRTADSGTRPRQ